MCEYYFWWLLAFIWKDIIPQTFGTICLPSYHNIITNQQTYKLLNRKDFLPRNSTGNILPMVLDKKNNRLIIGARDFIFYVDDITLKEFNAEHWKGDEAKISSCKSHGTMPIDSCANYIHFLAIHQGKLFVCGTNSLVPKYKLISLENFTTLKEKKAYGICSSRRDLPMVGDITDLGQLISGSYKDYYAKQPVISATSVNNIRQQRLIAERNVYMEQPEFISSVDVGDSVYIFLMEKAIENKYMKTSTVVRLCKGDNGASRLINENMWTTFRKSRLMCAINENEETFHFQYLVDVVYDKYQDVFYASYTMFKHNNMYSAVCTFLHKDIVDTFSGRFLDTSKGPNNIMSVDNGHFLIGCKVNPANLTKFVDPVNGKQPTKYLKRKAITKAMQYVLMERKVYNSDVFEFIKTGVSFTRLALHPVMQSKEGRGKRDLKSDFPLFLFQVLYIGAKSGNVLMVYKNQKSNPCIIKEISTDIGKVERLLLNEEKRRLYISSDTNVISLNVEDCHVYVSEDACVKSHNPLCGWSTSKQLCVATWNETNVNQDLNICPSKSDIFGPWSKWSTCEYPVKKYCRCRHRKCTSWNIWLCNNFPYTQVKNCSVNSVKNLSKWENEGSIDGMWSKWLPWSTCNVSKCGNNTMSRIKLCLSPAPANGGRKCKGDSFQCKSCPQNPVLINTMWGGWGNWGECTKTKGAYIWNRTRTCSKPNSCPGSSIKKLLCAPNGIMWGSWSVWSCAQRVRHRYPLLINGCDNCTQLTYPKYEVCDCFVNTVTSKEIITSPATTTTKICTPAPSSKEPLKSTYADIERTELITKKQTKTITSNPILVPTIVNVSPAPQSNPRCNPENQFTFKQLIIINTIVIGACFLIFGLIIYLILRRKHSTKMLLNGRANSMDRTPLRNFNPET